MRPAEVQDTASPATPWLDEFPQLLDGTAYLDSAAFGLRLTRVIETVREVSIVSCSNVRRGRYPTAEHATARFEAAREQIAAFLGAGPSELVFTRNCTDALNLVARGLRLGSADEVLISPLEHSSNDFPWRSLPCRVRQLRLDARGRLDLQSLEDALTDRVRVLALTHVSNVTGALQPVAEAAALCRQAGVLTVIDGAQAVGHLAIDVKQLGVDYYAFSSAKALGPSGLGGLIGDEDALSRLEPLIHGGGMYAGFADEGPTYIQGVHRLEAGTPNIEGVIGLAAAIDFFSRWGIERLAGHTEALSRDCRVALDELQVLDFPFGNDLDRQPIIAFTPRSRRMPLAQIAAILADSYGVALREGTHCAPSLFRSSGVPSVLRASLHCYNRRDDVHRLVEALRGLRGLLQG